jgi:hypothetical protein
MFTHDLPEQEICLQYNTKGDTIMDNQLNVNYNSYLLNTQIQGGMKNTSLLAGKHEEKVERCWHAKE